MNSDFIFKLELTRKQKNKKNHCPQAGLPRKFPGIVEADKHVVD